MCLKSSIPVHSPIILIWMRIMSLVTRCVGVKDMEWKAWISMFKSTLFQICDKLKVQEFKTLKWNDVKSGCSFDEAHPFYSIFRISAHLVIGGIVLNNGFRYQHHRISNNSCAQMRHKLWLVWAGYKIGYWWHPRSVESSSVRRNKFFKFFYFRSMNIDW